MCVCVRYVSNSHVNDFRKGRRDVGRFKTLRQRKSIADKRIPTSREPSMKRKDGELIQQPKYFQHSFQSFFTVIIAVPIFLNQEASQFRTSSAITTSYPRS